jgi:hypothetical protein
LAIVITGLSAAEAPRARLEFGGIEEAKEEVRETWLWWWLGYGIRVSPIGPGVLHKRSQAAESEPLNDF